MLIDTEAMKTILSAIKAERNAQGTNENSRIPTVTTADNGKFLMVVDGEWAAVTIQDASEVEF